MCIENNNHSKSKRMARSPGHGFFFSLPPNTNEKKKRSNHSPSSGLIVSLKLRRSDTSGKSNLQVDGRDSSERSGFGKRDNETKKLVPLIFDNYFHLFPSSQLGNLKIINTLSSLLILIRLKEMQRKKEKKRKEKKRKEKKRKEKKRKEKKRKEKKRKEKKRKV